MNGLCVEDVQAVSELTSQPFLTGELPNLYKIWKLDTIS